MQHFLPPGTNIGGTPWAKVYKFTADWKRNSGVYQELPDFPLRLGRGEPGVSDTGGGIVSDKQRYIYLVGGAVRDNLPGGGVITGTEKGFRYDTLTGRYNYLAPAPKRLAYGHMGYINGKVYYAGGAAGFTNKTTPWTLELNTLTNRWRYMANMPDPRHSGATGTANGMLYVLGGQHGHDALLTSHNTSSVFDPATNRYSAKCGWFYS